MILPWMSSICLVTWLSSLQPPSPHLPRSCGPLQVLAGEMLLHCWLNEEALEPRLSSDPCTALHQSDLLCIRIAVKITIPPLHSIQTAMPLPQGLLRHSQSLHPLPQTGTQGSKMSLGNQGWVNLLVFNASVSCHSPAALGHHRSWCQPGTQCPLRLNCHTRVVLKGSWRGQAEPA